MKTNILHIIIALWAICLACASCSQDDISQPVSVTRDGQVKIVYKVAGASLSRADTEENQLSTEEGWDDENNDETDEWHENIINRIDLFVFDADGKCIHHIIEKNIGVTDAQQEDSYTNFKNNGELTELTYAEVAANKDNYTYYMVANCELDDIIEGQSTLTDLKAKLTPDLTFNQHPDAFAMDGKLEPSEVVVNETDKTATLQFELARTAVKIRVSVLDENKNSIISQCIFRLHNYVLNGTSVLAEEEKNWYGEGYGQTRTPESEELAWNNVLHKDNQAVFYSYPNDWFDETKKEEQADGTWIINDYENTLPIIEGKQTYILLEAPFENKNYYYKVPVNYTIYKNNDAVSFTEDEMEEIHDLYRIQRNHIYDITVTIDRAGGITEDTPVTLTNDIDWIVNDWGDMNVNVPKFD